MGYMQQAVNFQKYTIKYLKMQRDYQMERTNNRNQIYDKMLEDQYDSPREQPVETDPSIRLESPQGGEKIEMVIDFGHNSSASLMVGSNDDPLTLAKKFCFKHNIDPHVISTLSANIRNLQSTSFQPCYRVEKNTSFHEDKQNVMNNSNYIRRSRSKSQEKGQLNSRLSMSRSKTNQSFANQSSTAKQNKNSSSGYNVFERLYQQSRKKQTARTNNYTSKRGESSRVSMMAQNKSLNESSIQGCIQIYDKNLKLKEESLLHNQHLLEVKQRKEVEQCSFKPQINPLSNLIASKLRELDQSSILNRTSNDKSMLKIKEYLLKKEQDEMKQCTFKPTIINKIARNQNQISSHRFKQLYEDHQVRESKKQVGIRGACNQEESYQPEINKISKIIVKKNFYQRLEEDKEKRIEKRMSLEKIKRDQSKERRPSTGRAPVNRNLQSKTIGEYLYEKSRVSRALSTKEQPQIQIDPHSSQIHSKSKLLAVQYIFELLDNDQDGLISNTKINIGALSQEVLRLLAPLLAEMEEVDVQLNLEEFQTAFQRLYSTFSIDEKNVILKSYKTKQYSSKISERPSFNPSLNEYSLRIARQLTSDDVDIYESSMTRLKDKQNKLNRMRAEKMLEQYSECTFHPRVHRY